MEEIRRTKQILMGGWVDFIFEVGDSEEWDRIWVSHSGGYEEYHILGYNAL
jgi:hypothetical protein